MGAEPTVTALAARVAIRELRHRYSRHVDDCAWDAWAELFTEDAVCDYEGRPPLDGRRAIREFGRSVLDREYRFTMHVPLLPVIDIEGDTATGRWYLVLWYGRSDGDAGWRLGRYHDEYRRVDGTWKFAGVGTIMHAHSGDSFALEMTDDQHYGKEMATYRSR